MDGMRISEPVLRSGAPVSTLRYDEAPEPILDSCLNAPAEAGGSIADLLGQDAS